MIFGTTSGGGITNSGTIFATASGIGVFNVATFLGSIVNRTGGKIITSKDGIDVSSVVIFGTTSAGGGITNSGTISVGQVGIQLGGQGLPAFTGKIVNSGAITARTGIAVLGGSTIFGAILDSGTIKATSHGILIDSASEILATKTAIAVAGSVFTGGISNFGVISGSAGIEIKTAHPVSIFDAGKIIAAPGGTAIQFAGSGNTLTLGAGYVISGIVDPSGKNTFQLGGTGSGTFDLNSIGSGAQYRGFTTFNVVGGTWTVLGAGSGWNVNGGTLALPVGGLLLSTTVHSGGTLEVLSGAHVSATTVSNSGTFLVSSGGTADPTRVLSGGTEIVASGAFDDGAQISGGVLVVQSGGSATNTNVRSGGTEAVQSGAIVSGVISSGGALELVGSGATSGGLTVRSGATFEFASGYVNSAGVSAGTPVKVLAGGTQDGGVVLSGGVLEVLSGGIASGVTVDSGGKLIVFSGGTGIDFTVDSGGTAINSAGGTLDVAVSATDSGTLINSGAINVQDGATLTVGAATLSNTGSINLGSGVSGGTLLIDHNVTLTGGGTVSMPGEASLITDSGHGFTLTNVNDKIVGNGALGAEFALFVNNQVSGVIDGGNLEILATVTNAGLIEGHDVIMTGAITNSGTIAALGINAVVQLFAETVTNSTTKALILASGIDARVLIDATTVSGGTLKTSAGGEITTEGAALRGVKIAASSLIEVTPGTLTLNGGTIGAGAIIETLTGGTAIVSGTVANGGTLFATGLGSLIEIASGGVVNGGVALIGDGIVDIAGSSGESVRFLSSGSGGLEIADTKGHTSAFSGRVSGFGGSGHSNHEQFIDLVSVTSAPNTISLSYVSAASHTSGTLFVSSGGAVVAQINILLKSLALPRGLEPLFSP